MLIILLSILIFPPKPEAEVCVSQSEYELFQMINDYRVSRGLNTIPFSPSLTKVSQAHVNDLAENYEYKPNPRCNPHSWSKKGDWTSCCYTNDHKQAKCMWDKPREIADYDSEGFEILFYASNGAQPQQALEGWKDSPGHHPLIINTGQWAQLEWKAMGVGIQGEWAVVWLGRIDDSDNQIVRCN